jgi:hypothetical protein
LPEPDPDPDPLPPNEPEPVPAFGTAEASSEAPQETSAEPLETAAQLTPSEIAPLLAPAEDPRPTEESTQSNEAFAGDAQASESDGVEAFTTEAPAIEAPPTGDAPPAEAPVQESAPAASPNEASSHEASPIETSLNEAEPNGIAQAPLETQPELPVAQAAPGEPAPKPPSQNLAPHWLLSLFSPAAADTVEWSRGNYSLIERGGRVESPAGSGALKKQVRMVAEGSVLYAGSALHGAAPDVAPDGFAHPVFRAGFALAIPLPEVR